MAAAPHVTPAPTSEPLDELSLALLVRRAPDTPLYAQHAQTVHSMVFVQHALCCLRERQCKPESLYHYTVGMPSRGVLSDNAKARQCAECGGNVDRPVYVEES